MVDFKLDTSLNLCSYLYGSLHSKLLLPNPRIYTVPTLISFSQLSFPDLYDLCCSYEICIFPVANLWWRWRLLTAVFLGNGYFVSPSCDRTLLRYMYKTIPVAVGPVHPSRSQGSATPAALTLHTVWRVNSKLGRYPFKPSHMSREQPLGYLQQISIARTPRMQDTTHPPPKHKL